MTICEPLAAPIFKYRIGEENNDNRNSDKHDRIIEIQLSRPDPTKVHPNKKAKYKEEKAREANQINTIQGMILVDTEYQGVVNLVLYPG